MADHPPGARSPRLSPWGVDALLAVAVATVLSAVIAAEQGGRQAPDPLAYLWALGLGALMLVRRRYPRLVLLVTALGLFTYYAAGYPAIGLAVPAAVALFSAAEARRLIAAVATAVTLVVVSLFFRLLDGQDVAFVVGYDLVGHVALMAAAIALGDSVRGRRAERAQRAQIAELTARQYAQEAETRIQAERLAIARDLHDSIGHTVSVISLHTDVASEALETDRAATARALAVIRDTVGAAGRDLRRTVGLLRTPTEPAPTMVSIRNVDNLVAAARASGITVAIDVRLPCDLPVTVDAAGFRIVQEAVTNAVRHSGATDLTIGVWVEEGALRLRIADNGDGAPGGPTGPTGPAGAAAGEVIVGHGLAGMTERAAALGGTLTARREGHGFVVAASLPLEPPS